MASILVNLALAVCAIAAFFAHGKDAPYRVVLRYFTMQSNLLCAAAALAVAVSRLFGEPAPWVLALKFVGTAAVSVTMLTVIFFLGPTLGYKLMFSGPDLWLHLICPVLAIASFLLWDRAPMGPGAVLLGGLPVLLYGCLYLRKVIFAPEERRWKDFYGFNRKGLWPLSMAVMTAAALLISWALWLCVR